MKFRANILKDVVLAFILLIFFFAITGLKASASPGEIGNSSALTHAVLAENATATW